jgi:hypothetical protein
MRLALRSPNGDGCILSYFVVRFCGDREGAESFLVSELDSPRVSIAIARRSVSTSRCRAAMHRSGDA